MIRLYYETEPLAPVRDLAPGEDPVTACREAEEASTARDDFFSGYAVVAVEVETSTVVAVADGLRADVLADEEGDGPMFAEIFEEVEAELRGES